MNIAANGPAPSVAVLGLGYIGLPTSAVIARAGMKVVGIDINPETVAMINSGAAHIEEVDLDALVHDVVASGRLRASLTCEPADVFVIAVPTPVAEGRRPDIAYLLAATRSIAPVLAAGNTVIVESTSPVGTTDTVCELLAELRPDLALPSRGKPGDVYVAYCPERVLPGRIIQELVENDRSIGGITPACAAAACRFYERFVRGRCTMTEARVAEMVKLAENSFRDVNIAFANELSLLAETLEVDVWEVIRLANRHPRVNILQPGPGVGGHCIAVDPWFLVASDPAQARLIRTAREVNDAKPHHVIARTRALIAANPGARIACLGLAFKADIDDFRESPALEIAEVLAHEFGDRVLIVEPFTESLPGTLGTTGARLVTLDEALEGAAILLLLVDHQVFRALDDDARSGRIVYDTRGIW